MNKKEKNLVGKQAALMSLGTFFSRILGFLRDLCIASLFSKTETDIFFVAFRFPNFFRRLLGEGSFSASITPVLTEVLHKHGKNKLKDVYSCLLTLLFCISVSLTLLGVLFMRDIMEFLFQNSAYDQIEGKLEKTIVAGRIVFAYLFFVSLYSYCMSVAQVFGRFFLPALAPAWFNISLLVFSFMPKSWWPFPSLALAWAVLLGGLLQLIPVLYEMYRLNLYPKWIFSLNHPAVLKSGKRFLPAMIGLSGLSLIGLINLYFIAWLEEGTASYIYYADRLLEFPRALIAISFGTALIPELTKLFSFEKQKAFKQTVVRYFNFLLFLTWPCALAFFILSEPLVDLVFGRGQFDSQSISQTALVLKFYSAVLIFSSLSKVLSSGFFAMGKNWSMVVCSFLFVCFHAFCAQIFTSNYGFRGLVASIALSSFFHFILLFGLLFYMLKGFSLKPILSSMFKNIPGLFLFGLCLFMHPYLKNILPEFLALSSVLLLGGGLYLFSAYLLKEQSSLELTSLIQQVLKIKKL